MVEIRSLSATWNLEEEEERTVLDLRAKAFAVGDESDLYGYGSGA